MDELSEPSAGFNHAGWSIFERDTKATEGSNRNQSHRRDLPWRTESLPTCRCPIMRRHGSKKEQRKREHFPRCILSVGTLIIIETLSPPGT
jgi:hypothetical protein